MCDICKNIHTKAQHRAFKRIEKREAEKIKRRLDNFKKLLKRKFFPESTSYTDCAWSKHDGKKFSSRFSSDNLQEDHREKWMKEKNVFYSFPQWAPNREIIYICYYFYYLDGGEVRRMSSGIGNRLIYNPPKELLAELKKRAREVQFPNAK